jgi:FKBP-type peptidyl-prolyl cis-trans isomerase SlyD
MTENQDAEVAEEEEAADDVADAEQPDADTEPADTEQAEEDGLSDGDFVRLDYTARAVESEQLVDTTDPEVAEEEGIDQEGQTIEPRIVVIGNGHIFPAVEDDLKGKEAGDSGSVVVPAAEAFGEHDPEEVRTVSADKIPEDDRYPGGQVQIDGEHGHIEAIIGGRARVNFNHPLAGEDVEYDYEILEVVEDRLERAQGILGTIVDVDLDMEIQDDEVEEEQLVEPDEEEATDDEEAEDEEEPEPEYETVEVEKETLYIEATPQLQMNQQWMFQKQQIAQDLVEHIDVDRVIVQEILGEGMGGMMGGMMGGGMGGVEEALEDADLDDADVDAEELVEEIEGAEE